MTNRGKIAITSALRRAETVLDRSDPSSRIEAASYVAGVFANKATTERENEISLAILHMLASDIEKDVRVAVAEQVKDSTDLPRALALAMVDDIEEVAVPIIRFSRVLTESDLMDVIESGELAKQIAVARRDRVSERLSAALVETGREEVVVTVLDNPNAEISEPSYDRVMDLFPESERVHKSMAERAALPMSAVERLVNCAAIEIQERMIKRYKIAPEEAKRLVTQAREDVLVRSAADRSASKLGDDHEFSGLAGRLQSKNQLSPSLVLRALATGELGLFESAMSVLGGLELEHTRTFLYKRGIGGLRMVFRNTGLPQPLFRPIKLALEIVDAAAETGKPPDRHGLSRKILACWVDNYDGLQAGPPEKVVASLAGRLFESEAGGAVRGAA